MSSLPRIYRLYCYDLARKEVTADFVTAASDEEVIAKAKASCIASKCEVWEGKRLVAQLEIARARSPGGV